MLQEWAKNWLYSRQGADAVAEPGLNWMLTLWAYRDAEVRTCDPTVLVIVDLKLESLWAINGPLTVPDPVQLGHSDPAV